MMYFLWISLATTILEESISNTNTPQITRKIRVLGNNWKARRIEVVYQRKLGKDFRFG